MIRNLSHLGVIFFFSLSGLVAGSQLVAVLLIAEHPRPVELSEWPGLILSVLASPIPGLAIAWIPAVATGLAAALVRRFTPRRFGYVGICTAIGFIITTIWASQFPKSGDGLRDTLTLASVGAFASFVGALVTMPRRSTNSQGAPLA